MAEIVTYFSILFFVVGISSGAQTPDCKNHKKTTHDSFVCVCTESQPCDKIEAPVKTAKDVVTRWESSRDGARMRKQTLHFGQKADLFAATGELHVNVNRDVKYQEIFGFGGAFTDAAAINIKKLSAKLQDQIINDYFSKDGSEYSIGRVPIGGSDYSTRAYSYMDGGEDKTLAKFNLTKEDLDFKIPIIQKAKSVATHEIKLFGSPWSAPAWMKTNNNLAHGGSIKGAVGTEYWQLWAKYLVHYLNSYKAHNITHWGMTVQNEPLGSWGFNSMRYTPETERDFIAKTLGPELEKSGYGIDKLKLMIYDDNVNPEVFETWVKTILSDKTAAKYVAGTAIHWYNHDKHAHLDGPHKDHPDKFILGTEACWGGPGLGNWDLAQRYSEDIIMDLLHNVVGYTDWNLALDMKGGPNWDNNFNDAPIIVDPDNHQYYRQPHYYAMAHFSKFLPPGSHRIELNTVTQKDNKAIVAAFRTPHDSTVLVVVNNNDEIIHLTVEDTKAGKLAATVDPKSIQTYVYYD